jgi:hypothetical protein
MNSKRSTLMKTAIIETAKQHTTVFLICLSVASVVFLKVGIGRTGTKESDSSRHKEGIKYICVGNVGAVIGDDEAPAQDGFNLEVPMARAKRHCRPPLLPDFEAAKLWSAAVAPSSGYGAVLLEVPGTKTQVLEKARQRLTQSGWSETGGSALGNVRRPDIGARTFDRKEAWLFATAYPKPSGNGTFLLLAGEWQRDLLEDIR